MIETLKLIFYFVWKKKTLKINQLKFFFVRVWFKWIINIYPIPSTVPFCFTTTPPKTIKEKNFFLPPLINNEGRWIRLIYIYIGERGENRVIHFEGELDQREREREKISLQKINAISKRRMMLKLNYLRLPKFIIFQLNSIYLFILIFPPFFLITISYD